MRKYNIFTIALLLFSMVGFVYAQGVIENPSIGDITTTNPITMKQQGTTPSNPISGYNKIYMKSDDKLYRLTSSGTEAEITSSALWSTIVENKHDYNVDGTRTDTYTADGSIAYPYKTIVAALTAINVDAAAHAAAGHYELTNYSINIAPGTYSDNLTFTNYKYMKVYAPAGGVFITGTITSTQTQQSGDYYSRLEFVGASGMRTEKGPALKLAGNITATRNNDSLTYISFSGCWITGNQLYDTDGTFVLHFNNSRVAGTIDTGTFSDADSAVLIETTGWNEFAGAITDKVSFYNVDNVEFYGVINTTPIFDSRITNSRFGAAVTINAKNLYIDAKSYKSLVAQTETLTGATVIPLEDVLPSATEVKIPNSVEIGSTTAGKNLTVYATRTSIHTFDAANWNEDGATWTMTGTGPLVHVNGNTTTVTATNTEAIVAGTTYRVTITGTGGGGTATYTLGGVYGTTIASSGAIAIEDFITASTTASMIITPASASTISITSITIEKLTDNTGDVTVGGNLKVRSQILAINYAGSTQYPQYSFLGSEQYGFGLYSASSMGFYFAKSIKHYFTVDTFAVLSDTGTLQLGASQDVRLYRDGAADTLAQRRTTNQQIYRLYNTYTDASDYERGVLTGVQGASINLTAETAGTGGDNLDIILTPAGTGSTKVKGPLVKMSSTTNTGGGLARNIAEATGTPSGTTTYFDITLSIPTGSILQGCQLRVDTALTAGETWSAAFNGGSSTSLAGAGQAVAKNTKVNTLVTPEITTNTTNVRVTRDSGNFTNAAGVIRAVCYYESLVALSDNP